ncbi:MAG: hypothetical protein ACKOEY_16040 [Phenylobacterium sp.]
MLAALLVGCASAPEGEGRTPAALMTEADTLVRASGSYPEFSDIPDLPTDVRPLAEWGRAARSVMSEGLSLERNTTEATWILDNTEAFAARARVDAGPPAPTVSATPAAEAFAREIRRRATPPPPSPR